MRILLLAAVAAATLSVTGCAADAVCRSGEYPVKAVGNTTGKACVADNEQPPQGYVRYPDGKVPQHVGDKWDEYWSTVIVDEQGAIVSS